MYLFVPSSFQKSFFLMLLLSLFYFHSISAQQMGDTPTLSIKNKAINIPQINGLAVLYDQYDTIGTSIITSQDFEAINDSFDTEAADDFIVPTGVSWTLSTLIVGGGYYNGFGPANTVNVKIYTDKNHKPKNLVYSASVAPSFDTLGTFILDLSSPAQLCSGTYWLEIQVQMDFALGGQWGWGERAIQSNSESVWKNPIGGFGTPCTNWGARVTSCLVGTDPDLLFVLYGTVDPACAITVTSPNTNVSWALGSTHDITWTDNLSENVKITLLKAGAPVLTIANNTPSDGLFSWTIPTTLTPASDYKVQISGKVNTRVKDNSNKNFTITAVSEKPEEIAELSQNYPNPFNPSTVISYSIPFEGSVRVRVFNMLGEMVSELVNQTQAQGDYEAVFDGSNLASGMYFYSIEAVSFDGSQNLNEVKKMLLQK